MKLIWNGHSCFTVETEQGTVVFDPYAPGSVPGYPPLSLTADQVICSHGHADHNYTACVTLTGRTPSYEVSQLSTWHDPCQGAMRGPDIITILRAEGLKIAHLGDLGCPLTEQQIEQLQGLDALMIPVGGHFTIDAGEAETVVEQLSPRVVIPMHYRTGEYGYGVIGLLDDFLALRKDVVRHDSNVLVLTADTPAQTAVLALPV